MAGRATSILAAILMAACCASALGREPGFAEYRAVQESLSRVPARYRGGWLDRHGLKLPPWNAPLPTTGRDDSLGLRLVGKYGRGPSNEVTGQGDLVALTLGSEVALLSFANPDSPVVLSEIQFDLIPGQSALYDSFLVTSDNGIEFWNIADPRTPVFRSSIPYTVADFAIVDTFLFFVRGDTFHSYSIANPLSPYQLGTCVEGGYVTTATRNVAVIRAPGDVMGFVDVSNPSAPRVAGTYPSYALGADARGNICCASIYWSTDEDHFRFEVLDISDPANVRRLGYLDSCGGYDVFLDGPLAFVSGYYLDEYGFQIVTIADSTSPALVGSANTPGYRFGVWEDAVGERAYIADDAKGISVLDIHNLNMPAVDTSFMHAFTAVDVAVQGPLCYVADHASGLRVVDVSDPAHPVEVGGTDTTSLAFSCEAVAATDSFVFASWWPQPKLRSFDVTDPTRPTYAGGCNTFDQPKAVVLRDTLLYCAMPNRFQVINVARPRQPVLVGTCITADVTQAQLCLQDSFAYIAYWPTEVINVADPTQPVRVGAFNHGAAGISVRDTLAFLANGGLYAFSVATPSSPYPIDSLVGQFQAWSVVVVDTLAYVGARNELVLVNVANPHWMTVLARLRMPDVVCKLTYAPPHLYAASLGAGVCIIDTASVGLAEQSPPPPPHVAWPTSSVIRDRMVLNLPELNGKEVIITAFDVAGNVVYSCALRGQTRAAELSLAQLPTGVYMLRVSCYGWATSFKFVKL